MKIIDYITDLDYSQTATLIHVLADSIRERISFAEAYDNLGAFIHPIHAEESGSINPMIEDIEDPRKLTNLITINALRLENMLKVSDL